MRAQLSHFSQTNTLLILKEQILPRLRKVINTASAGRTVNKSVLSFRLVEYEYKYNRLSGIQPQYSKYSTVRIAGSPLTLLR